MPRPPALVEIIDYHHKRVVRAIEAEDFNLAALHYKHLEIYMLLLAIEKERQG